MTTPDNLETLTKASGGNHRGQIKTRDRVRELAEVYTHQREINAMLDLVPDMFPAGASGADIKFLEPACGSGNFLEEILGRKLRDIRFSGIRTTGAYEHRILRAVASIYGVDISTENVTESRDRMVTRALSHYYGDTNSVEPTDGFLSALHSILATNIVQANFLSDARSIELIDYKPIRRGHFRRVWSLLEEPTPDRQQGLFHSESRIKQDEVPIHYLDLASTPEPTREGAYMTRIDRRV